MKKKIILPFLILSFFLFIIKFIKIFRVIFYLIITGNLRKIYLLRGVVTLIKINDTTVLKLPTEYDFIVCLGCYEKIIFGEKDRTGLPSA